MVFAPFGHIIGISIAKDSSGHGAGTGTVQCVAHCPHPPCLMSPLPAVAPLCQGLPASNAGVLSCIAPRVRGGVQYSELLIWTARRFGSSSDAEKAIQNLDGLEIAGARIMVEMGPPIPGALDPAMAANMLSAGFGSEQPTSLEEQGEGAIQCPEPCGLRIGVFAGLVGGTVSLSVSALIPRPSAVPAPFPAEQCGCKGSVDQA